MAPNEQSGLFWGQGTFTGPFDDILDQNITPENMDMHGQAICSGF